MRFMYENQEYEILFNRDYKMVEVVDRKKNEKRDEISKYPLTAVMILKVDPHKRAQFWEVPYMTEVGCSPKDKFSPEEGRIWALKKLSGLKNGDKVVFPRIIPEEMVPLMWEAYNTRVKKVSLKEKNRQLRHEVEILKKLNTQLEESYTKLLRSGMDV